MRLEAVNNILILKKDNGGMKFNFKIDDMRQVPPPYSGVIDSVGNTDKYKIGQHVIFNDVGGLYMEFGGVEYVIITPEMVMGILPD